MEEAERQRSEEQLAQRAATSQQKDTGLTGTEPPKNSDEIPVEESMEARLERLGRQRPEIFPSLLAEIGFIFSVCMSQVFGVSIPSLIRCASHIDERERNTSFLDSLLFCQRS